MTTVEYAESVISHFNKRITNQVFLSIQNDPHLMHEYLQVVSEHGVQAVNMAIGRAVKDSYHLSNMNDREDAPTCTLIQSHQIFE